MKVVMLMRDDPNEIVGGIPTYTRELTKCFQSKDIEIEWAIGNSDINTVNIGGEITGCDLVHAMSLPYGAKVHIPMIVTCHSPLAEESRYYSPLKRLKGLLARRFENQTIAKAKLVIAVSNFTKDILTKDYGLQESKITVVPHGVDSEAFNPSGKSFSGPPKILICSRLDPRKNIGEALDALAEIREEEFELAVIGDGPERERLEARARNLQHHAFFLGTVSEDEMTKNFSYCNIFLTTAFSEGFGLSLLQAMASGCAVVVSDTPVHRELVEDGVDGIVYSNRSDLVSKLRSLLRNKDLAERLGKKAREKAKTYSWERTAKSTLELYKKLVDLR
jgi:glycosyltransferase involved in cell wall biosynthesis